MNYILTNWEKKKKLKIYEIGGGNGTFALEALNYLKQQHYEIYKHTTYSIIEISEALSRIQMESISPIHSSVIQFYGNTSILDWNKQEKEECFIIGIELMDNCLFFSFSSQPVPHDKLIITSKNEIFETRVEKDQEIYYPVEDDYIKKYLSIIDKNQLISPTSIREKMRNFLFSIPLLNGNIEVYIPTMQWMMLEKMKLFEHHHLSLEFPF
jgi:SAM-dependent MidA family methyltransferase